MCLERPKCGNFFGCKPCRRTALPPEFISSGGEMAVPVWAREKERSRDNRPLARRYGLWSSMLLPRMGMGWTRNASIFSQNPALQEQGWGTQGSSRLMPLESLGRRKVTLLVSKKSRTTSWRWSPKELGSWPHWVLFTQSSTSVPS